MGKVITPGVNVRVTTATKTASRVGAIDTTFMPVVSERGPAGPVEIGSIGAYQELYGRRTVAGSLSYDVVEALTTGSGGRRVVVVRVTGPGAKAATVQAATTNLVLTASSVGAWGNGLKVVSETNSAGGLDVVLSLDTKPVWRGYGLKTWGDVIDGLQRTGLIVATSANVTASATKFDDAALATGADDDGAITIEHVDAVLAMMTSDWGPGQVIAPNWTSAQAHQMLLAHAAVTNRVAYLDAPLAEKADADTLNSWVEARNRVSEYGVEGQDVSRLGLFFPVWCWLAPYGTINQVARRVPGSVLAAAVTARHDVSNPPNSMPIADRGFPAGRIFDRPVVAVSPELRTVMTDAGLNAPHHDLRGVRLFGFRSVTLQPQWRQANWSRYVMALQARVAQRGESYIGQPITAKTLAALGAEVALLLTADFQAGQLVGATTDEAFSVDVSEAVNPAAQVAAGVMAVRVELATTSAGEMVQFDLIKKN